ncbi:MAG TPA: hypothetical protein VFS08_06230 [Gemmatimonadaceae bacterium]|nr:hypothetical protein [Gemmatimonadaceae bacterium]
MPDMPEQFQSWAIVEVMGHKTYAGFVSSQQVGGSMLVRVDVPDTRARAAYTKLLGTGSIFCITPCDEALARRAAERVEQYNDPIPVYLPVERQLPASTGGSSSGNEDPEDETEDAVLVPGGEGDFGDSDSEDEDDDDFPL